MRERLKIDYVPTAALIPNRRNARIHSERQLEVIENSIRRFGFIVPIIRDDELNIIAGHGRVMAAQKHGVAEVPTINVKHLSEKQREEFMHVDNRIGDMSDFDVEKLGVGLIDLIEDDEDRERLLALGFTKYDLDIDLDGVDKAPSEFAEYDDGIKTAHECPKCGYTW